MDFEVTYFEVTQSKYRLVYFYLEEWSIPGVFAYFSKPYCENIMLNFKVLLSFTAGLEQ